MSDNQSGNDGSNDSPSDDASTDPASKKSNGKRGLIIATVFAATVLALTFAIYQYLGRDIRADAWEEPTLAYEDATCEEGGCETFTFGGIGHGTHGDEGTASLVYNPAIDDEIAQWGDCRGEIQVCIQSAMMEAADPGDDQSRVSIINACVAAAETCPAICKSYYAERTTGRDFGAVEEQYFSIFEDEGGYCVPREADE